MNIVKTVALVAFVIICVILILLVLVQNEENNGMGSAFGGGQSTAFGAHSANVITKTTGVFVALFFVAAFGLALLNKAPKKADLSETVKQVQGAESENNAADENWLKDEVEKPAAEQTVIETPAEAAAATE